MLSADPAPGRAPGAPRTHRLAAPLLAGVLLTLAFSTTAIAQAAPVDLARGKPTSASSVYRAGFESVRAVDGFSTTRWSSKFVDNQWWQVDLGGVRKVETVELNWERAYASRYKILTSANGALFTEAADVRITAAGLRRTTFAARDARYVRVLGVTRATRWGLSLWDARVFAPAADVTPPETTIATGPSGPTSSASASFSFSASESGATFECRLDSGSWAACASPKAYSGLAVGSHSFAVRATDQAGNVDASPATRSWTIAAPASSSLTWRPPALSNPTTVTVSNANRSLVLDNARDYIVKMPSTPLTASGGLSISGGRNVVLVGGTISIPWQGSTPPTNSRRAMYLKNQTGTIHVEGVLMTGADIAEGIDLDQRLGATVQLQNIRVEGIHARDQQGFTDTHPDVIQTWGGPAELRVDRLTGSTDYQGFFLHPEQFHDVPPRMFDLRRVDLTGASTAGYLLWKATTGWPHRATDVWVRPNPSKGFSKTLWPTTTTWSGVRDASGDPAQFVPAGVAGTNYSSPGYAP